MFIEEAGVIIRMINHNQFRPGTTRQDGRIHRDDRPTQHSVLV